MIVGVGIDLVPVKRAAALLERHGARLLARCFSAGEVTRNDDAEHVAGLLAAKEAAFKALGTGWGDGVGWTHVTVRRDDRGRPVLDLNGPAAARARTLGSDAAHLSLTHAGGHALAVVILERMC